MSSTVDGADLDADADALAVVPQSMAVSNGRPEMSSSLAQVPSVQDAFSRPPLGTWIHAKQAQESAIITAMRRQMEALEDKLSGHIVREVTRVQQQGDRLREAAIARVDAKIATLEALQTKFDRRLAEISGTSKGLSEEMQSQIRRIDQMDARIWEWRHQMDEDVRAKLAEVEQNYQQISTSVRVAKATHDDVLKRCTARIVRLEELLEERVAHAEDLSQSLMDLHGRLMQVEDPDLTRQAVKRECARAEPPEDSIGSGAIAVLEKQHSDFLQKFEQLQNESSDLRAQVESQEERYRSLRTLCETKDEQYRTLGDRLERENWEGRLKDLHSRVHDCEQGRIGHAEQLEILHQKLELQDQGRGQLGHARMGRLQEQAVQGFDASEAGLCAARLAQAEERIGALYEELEAIRTDLELAPRVAALVAALKDVAPKVIAHDAAVAQLQAGLGKLSEQLEERLAQVWADVQRLVDSGAGS